MRFTNRIAGCAFLCLTIGLMAFAQDAQNKRGAQAQKEQGGKGNFLPSRDQQSALIILDQLLGATKTFDDDLLKIRTQARIADMLWPYDEPRARRQFEESFRAVNSARAAASPSSVSPPGIPFMQTSPFSELRNEILALIARRDADLAEKLIKLAADDSSDKDSGEKAQTKASQNERYDLYLQAALSIAKSDPARAAQLAKASLGGGISPDIIKVLFALRATNPAAADGLFSAALMAARQDGRHASMNIATLAPYILPEFTTMGAGVTSQPALPLVREFLNFAYDAFLQLSGVAAQLGLPDANYSPVAPNPMDYMTGQRLLPSFIRYMPDKAATFRQSVDAIAGNVQHGNEADAVSKMFQPGSTDEILEQAQSEQNTFLKDLLYTRAAMSAMTGGDFDRALSVVEKLGDEGRRASLDSIIRLQASSAALKKEDFDSALRYAEGVSDLRQRAYLYGTIARALLDKNNGTRAAQVLDDAVRAIDKADDDTVKANALLIIAEVKARLDPWQGFDAVSIAVKAFNRADSAKANNSRTTAPASGNTALSAVLNSTLKLDTPSFDAVFSALAKVDFNRAVQLARSLDKQERSVESQLAACRGVLSVKRDKTAQDTQGAGRKSTKAAP